MAALTDALCDIIPAELPSLPKFALLRAHGSSAHGERGGKLFKRTHLLFSRYTVTVYLEKREGQHATDMITSHNAITLGTFQPLLECTPNPPATDTTPQTGHRHSLSLVHSSGMVYWSGGSGHLHLLYSVRHSKILLFQRAFGKR